MVEKSVACDTNPKAGRRGLLLRRRADLEWPWRGTALDGAELPVTCSLPARRCGRPPLPSLSFPAASPAKHSSDSPLNVSAVSLLALPFHPSILLSHLLRVPREVARNHESVSTYSWMWMKSWSDNRIALFRSHSKESGDLPRCGFFDLLGRKLLTKMRNFEGSD